MLKIYGTDRREFFQWDLNQKLIIEDATVNEVHFCNGTYGYALVVEVYEYDGLRVANVPNILLQEIKPIKVYSYCNGSYTKEMVIFNVVARSKPADYVYTETEVKRWDHLGEAVDTLQKESENHEFRIRRLEYENFPTLFHEDFSEGMIKNVPNFSCSYAQVSKIYGTSYYARNLLSIPNQTVTTGGVTCVAEDGVITMTGTANVIGAVRLEIEPFDMQGYYMLCPFREGTTTATTSYVQVLNTDKGSTLATCDSLKATSAGRSTSTLTTAQVLSFQITAGSTYNCTFKPMLSKGYTIPNEYEPHYEGLRHTKVSAVISMGANRFNPENVEVVGVTLNNGVYTVTEDVTGLYIYDESAPFITLSNSSYVVMSSNSNIRIKMNGSLKGGSSLEMDSDSEGTYISSIGSLNSIEIISVDGSSLQGQSFQIGIYTDSKPEEFVPYRGEIDRITMPEYLLDYEGYGESLADDYYTKNYFDLPHRQYFWKGYYYPEVGESDSGSDAENINWVWQDDEYWEAVEEWEHEDEFIEVEPGGYLIFVNEYNYPVSAEVVYLKEVE